MAQARSWHCQCKREWVIFGVEYGRARRRSSQSYRGSNAGGTKRRMSGEGSVIRTEGDETVVRLFSKSILYWLLSLCGEAEHQCL